jgi:MFS family permease
MYIARATMLSSPSPSREPSDPRVRLKYAAINSAIDELIPARYRRRIDLVVNDSLWLGAAAGSGGSLLFLNSSLIAPNLGFAIGGLLCLGVLLMRRSVPESPRWLVTHGYARKAEAKVRDIEQRVAQGTRECLQPPGGGLEIRPRKSFGFGLIFRAMFERYRSRGILALTLMIAQSFLFNAVFFSYGLVLNSFHNVPKGRTGMYLAPLAARNFLGPLLLGRLFDTVGRRTMISGTYAVAGVLLMVTALGFGSDALSAWTQTLAWMLIFFFASAAASSALPDGKRKFSARDTSARNRRLLCSRHGNRWDRRAVPFRISGRHRLAMGAGRRVHVCSCSDACCRSGRSQFRRQRRGPILREYRRSAFGFVRLEYCPGA